jgi:type VI secretion system ImpM family protein
MSAPADVSAGLGWFGKIPALGDFAGRGLPASLVRPWDAWLSAELAESCRLLAERWAESYTQAPVLGFVLGAAVIDGNGWQGILLPSKDRVGREFPLTIARCRPAPATEAPGLEWWESLLSVGRQVLTQCRTADGVDELLAGFGGQQPTNISMGEPPSSDNAGTRGRVGPGQSAWWCFTAQESPIYAWTVFEGLPRGPALRRLLGFPLD